MARPEGARAGEGLKQLLCVQRSGSSPPPSTNLHLRSGKHPAHHVYLQALTSKFVPGFARQWPLVAQVIEVKFEKLDLEPDTYCRYDYVALFNGGETDHSRRIGKFCGDRAPG